MVKNLSAMHETPVPFLGRDDPLEKGQATHSRILELSWWLRWQRICLQYVRPGFDPWVEKMPWRRAWQPTLLFLPGESHGQRRLVGYSPWGHKELDKTEHYYYYYYIKIYIRCFINIGFMNQWNLIRNIWSICSHSSTNQTDTSLNNLLWRYG